MLHEYLILYREAIIEAAAAKAMRRGSPALSVEALRNGVPLFLAQVSETLRAETGETGAHALCSNDIADGATKHGAELLTGWVHRFGSRSFLWRHLPSGDRAGGRAERAGNGQ